MHFLHPKVQVQYNMMIIFLITVFFKSVWINQNSVLVVKLILVEFREVFFSIFSIFTALLKSVVFAAVM